MKDSFRHALFVRYREVVVACENRVYDTIDKQITAFDVKIALYFDGVKNCIIKQTHEMLMNKK